MQASTPPKSDDTVKFDNPYCKKTPFDGNDEVTNSPRYPGLVYGIPSSSSQPGLPVSDEKYPVLDTEFSTPPPSPGPGTHNYPQLDHEALNNRLQGTSSDTTGVANIQYPEFSADTSQPGTPTSGANSWCVCMAVP